MKILVIRRENIGDLILTTPLIALLSQDHHIDVLVNSYNKLVLNGNPHVHKIHHYTKSHHASSLKEKIMAFLGRLSTTYNVMREGYDVAIIAGQWNRRPLQWAKLSRARRVIAIGNDAPTTVTDKLTIQTNQHMVEQLAQLATPLGCSDQPGKIELFISPDEIARAARILSPQKNMPLYGLQISSRKEKQRWPVEKFVALAHQLAARETCRIILFWSPGASDNPSHPGDDAQAQQVLAACRDIMITPYSTENIRELMAGMSLCDQIVTSDGGALHIAAGVGKPVVALFGNSDAVAWAPWKVPSRVIQSADQNVASLTTDEVYRHFVALRTDVLNNHAE